jgi:hypothetical protein
MNAVRCGLCSSCTDAAAGRRFSFPAAGSLDPELKR